MSDHPFRDYPFSPSEYLRVAMTSMVIPHRPSELDNVSIGSSEEKAVSSDGERWRTDLRCEALHALMKMMVY